MQELIITTRQMCVNMHRILVAMCQISEHMHQHLLVNPLALGYKIR